MDRNGDERRNDGDACTAHIQTTGGAPDLLRTKRLPTASEHEVAALRRNGWAYADADADRWLVARLTGAGPGDQLQLHCRRLSRLFAVVASAAERIVRHPHEQS